MRLNLSKLLYILNGFNNKANRYIKHRKGLDKKLAEAISKANLNKGSLGEVWQKIQTFFALCTDYINGKYTDIDRKTVVAVIGSLLYFLSPVDLIPDFILGFGFLDDVFVIGYVYKKIAVEIDKYEAWQDSQRPTIHI